jgi:hypothetical protein
MAGDEATLVLKTVKIDGRAAQLFVFPDRLLLVDTTGSRTIPIRHVARIAHKAGLRTGRIMLTTVDGEEMVIRGLRARDTPTAYRILVRLATEANR